MERDGVALQRFRREGYLGVSVAWIVHRMSENLALIREILTEIRGTQTTLNALADSMPHGGRAEINRIGERLIKAKLIEWQGSFRMVLAVTRTGYDLLHLLQDEGAVESVQRELDASGRPIDLAALRGRLAAAKLPRARPGPQPPPLPHATSSSRRIFLAHGRDHDARGKVTTFLEKMGMDVVILDEQHSGGKTVIEKFEDNSDVNFAIVLLTGDDVGGIQGGDMRPRARQNVIFELGFFMGRLRRDRVCAIGSGVVELPSDIGGMVWVALDSPRWKRELATELEKAGYHIEWRKLVE